MTNPAASAPFLRKQRDFPGDDVKSFAVQVNKAYIDTSNAVNARTIGTFVQGVPIISGESWYVYGETRKQQTLRQVYAVTGAGSIAHNINVSTIGGFTRIYGTVTDGTNWCPVPYVDTSAASNQISLYVSASNIVITSPTVTITSGFIVLEWLGQ